MERFRVTTRFRDSIRPILALASILLVIAGAARFFLGKGDRKDATPVPETSGYVFVCDDCGREYTNQFPYVSPWKGYPTVLPSDQIRVLDETPDNDSIDQAMPVEVFQRVTGNLSSEDDVDFYSFTIDAPGNAYLSISYDGNTDGYQYVWDGTFYWSDGETELYSGGIHINSSKESGFNASIEEPVTFYLKISAAKGEDPTIYGYSAADYHINLSFQCSEHTFTTEVLTVEPTCSQAGELTTVCDICGEIASTERVQPLEHIWSRWRTVKGISLFSPLGRSSRVCSLCWEEETAPLLFHLFDRGSKKTAKAAAGDGTSPASDAEPCPVNDPAETLCPLCGKPTGKSTIIGHTYGEWVTTLTATCSAEGRQDRTCTACGHVESETIERLPHSYGEAVRVSGSILDAPIVSQETCTVCGYVNTLEDNRFRWVRPAMIVLGIAAAVAVLVVAVKRFRELRAAAAAVLALAARIFRELRGKADSKRRGRVFLCPHCLKASKLSEAEFRCTDQHCGSGRPLLKGDDVQWDAQGYPCSARCSCGKTTVNALCPKCHAPLPEGALTGNGMPIVVLDSRYMEVNPQS